MTSINDIRKAADRLYGTNKWSITDNYCYNVGMSKRSPGNGRKVYSLDNGAHWHLAKNLVNILTTTADNLNR